VTPDCETSVYGFLRNPSMVDFPGHLAAVFFVSGCNFSCGFCHNAALLQKRQKGITAARLEEVVQGFKKDWVDGAVISGGEPTLAPDLMDLLRFFKGHGFAVKLDTNGSRPDVLTSVLPLVDCVAMDVKCSLERYAELVEYSRGDTIRESISLIKEKASSYEFRTTVIEDFHTDDEMHRIGELIHGASRYVLQPFVPRDDLPSSDLRDRPRTSSERMPAVGELMRTYARNVVVKT